MIVRSKNLDCLNLATSKGQKSKIIRKFLQVPSRFTNVALGTLILSSRYILLSMIFILISGCGYTLAGTKSAIGSRYPNLAVRVGQNSTPYSDLESRCIEAVKALAMRYRDVRLVEDPNKADASIIVNLLSYDTAFGAIGKTGTFDIDEYNVLTYRVDLVDSTGTTVWTSGEQKATSFSALSLAAFDEGGFETLSRGFSARDVRSARDVASIESDQIFIAFAQSVSETVENALFDTGF